MANIWEKFDKAIDTEGLKKDMEAAADGKSEFVEIPVGEYEVKVALMELTESKKGAPMLTIRFKIINGDFENSLIFYNQVLSNGYGLHNASEFLRALDSGIDVKFDNFEQYNNVILDIAEEINEHREYVLDYSKNNKGFNVYEIKEVFEV